MTSAHRSSWLAWIAFGVILVHAILVVHGASRHSAVFDEVVYPVSGYAYLTTGDYRLNPEHPPWMKLWAGLAWLGIGRDVRALPGWEIPDQWEVSQALIYDSGLDPQALLMRARWMTVLLSLVLACGVFVQARRHCGERAGLIALILYAFDPLVIAHAGFATTDLGATAWFFLAAMSFPRAFTAPTGRAAGISGILLGLALASKFSSLLLLAVLAAVAVLEFRHHAAARAVGGSPFRWYRVAIVLAGALGVVAVCYGPTGPQSYLSGLSLLKLHADLGHPTFAFGLYATQGWWWYFPAAWLIKTPIPILAASMAGIVALAARLRGGPTVLWVLLGTPLAVLTTAMASPLNLGVRHLLPVTPFLAVIGGIAAERLLARRISGLRWVVFAALLWLIVDTARVHPDELAYSNALVGGPAETWRYLSDSNVDWGQDLPALAERVKREPLRRLYLAYFGTADPAAHGLRYTWIPSTRMIDRRFESGPDPAGREWIAISVTQLMEVPSLRHDAYAWLRQRPFTDFPGHSIALFDITDDPSAHRALARIAVERGDFEAARIPLVRAVELSPDDLRLRVELVRALRATERRAETDAHCRMLSRHLAAGPFEAICGGSEPAR